MFSSSGSTVTLAQLQRAFLHRTSTAIGAMFFVRAMQPHVPLGQASSLTQIMLPHVPLAYVRLVCFPILPMLDTGSAGRSDAPVPEVLGSLSRCPCHDVSFNSRVQPGKTEIHLSHLPRSVGVIQQRADGSDSLLWFFFGCPLRVSQVWTWCTSPGTAS